MRERSEEDIPRRLTCMSDRNFVLLFLVRTLNVEAVTCGLCDVFTFQEHMSGGVTWGGRMGGKEGGGE